MTTAVRSDIREEILRILREDISFYVQDGEDGMAISPDAIIYLPTRVQKQRDFNDSGQALDLPGIVVSDPLRIVINPSEGTNERDLWRHRWLIQVIDQNLWQIPGRVGTWEKWTEQICSVFQFNCLNSAVTLPKAQIFWTNAHPVSDIDETQWVREGNFIAGVELEVMVSQPRGVYL